ncbi:MAG: zeta toxin family protein [Bacillota bacterium]|nr:zeta toxin family protein [Bacillota bacterium]
MKRYIILAGVNGAGKSTLYETLNELKGMPRINIDEIVKELGDWRDTSVLMTAGRKAVTLLNQYLSEGISFNQETTLCGKAILKNIRKAKEMGYRIELHYVGVDSVDIAKERVKLRVSEGGHGIPEADIERRYVETFKNLKDVLKYCDLAAFYDNTVQFHRFAIFRNGKIARVSNTLPIWFKEKEFV